MLRQHKHHHDSLLIGLTAIAWLALTLFALAMLAGQALAATAKEADISANWQESSIRTTDGRLAYASFGTGPTLFVVPGGPGGSGFGLRHWFEPLGKAHRVVIVDNLGRGRSSRLADTKRYTVARDAQDLELLRKHFGLAKIDLYGHSYGGLVAQFYASEHPSKVEHLVLGNTLHGAQSWQRQIEYFKQWALTHWPDRWQSLMSQRRQGMLSSDSAFQAEYGAWIEPLYWFNPANAKQRPPGSTNPSDRFNQQVYAALLGTDPEWLVGGNLREVELLPRLSSVSAATLIVTGRTDPVAPPLVALEMQRALKNTQARLLIFEQSGHRPFIEEPTLWVQAISDFLR